MPPPTTNKVSGISLRSRAVFEVKMLLLFSGTIGNKLDRDPLAIIQLSNKIFVFLFLSSICSSLFERKEASPHKTSTPRALAICDMPRFNFVTILSLCFLI